jgi:hypothetical protein
MNKEMRSTLAAILILTICTATFTTSLFLIAASGVTLTRVFLGSFTQKGYLPVLVLYDPPGDGSYEECLRANNASLALQMEGTSQVEVDGSIQISEMPGWGVGRGKGDVIEGCVYKLTWNVYRYHYFNRFTNVTHEYLDLDLVSSIHSGLFACLRGGLAVLNCSVENKTGQPAADTYHRVIPAGVPVDYWFNYTWYLTIETGFSFNVTISLPGQPVAVVPVSYSFFCSKPLVVGCVAHFYDSSHQLDFYEAADYANFPLGLVYSYALWYNPG